MSHVSYREQDEEYVCVFQFAAEKNMPFSFRNNSKSHKQLTRSLLLILHLRPSSFFEVKFLAMRVKSSHFYQRSGRHAGTWNCDWSHSNVKSKCHGEQQKIHDAPSKIRKRKRNTAVGVKHGYHTKSFVFLTSSILKRSE